MKLLSGSIETEKCGNTEKKKKKAMLPLKSSLFSDIVDGTSTQHSAVIIIIINNNNDITGKPPAPPFRGQPSSMYQKHFVYTWICYKQLFYFPD